MCKDQWEEVLKTRWIVGFYVYRLVKQSALYGTLHVSETTDIKGTIFLFLFYLCKGTIYEMKCKKQRKILLLDPRPSTYILIKF